MDDAHEIVAAYRAAKAREWARFAGRVAEDVMYEAPQTQGAGRRHWRFVRRLWTTLWTGQWKH